MLLLPALAQEPTHPAPAQLVEALADIDPAARRRALDALASHQDRRGVAQALLALLTENDPATTGEHDQWITAVGGRGYRRDPSGLEHPISLVLDADVSSATPPHAIEDDLDLQFAWPPRALAAYALGVQGDCDEATIRGLLVAIHDQDELVAVQSIHALARLGPACAPAALAALEQKPSRYLVWLLAQWPQACVASLPGFLRHASKGVVANACKLAVACGAQRPEVHAALAEALTAARGTSAAAPFAAALRSIGEAAAPALLPALRAGGTAQRRAAGVLALMRPRRGADTLSLPAEVTDALLATVENGSLLSAHWSALALADLALDAERKLRIRAALLAKTRVRAIRQRAMACRHIARLAGGDDEMRGALLRCLADAAPEVVREAAIAFADLGPPMPSDVFDVLLAGTAEHDVGARAALVRWIARDGELRAALGDEDHPWRTDADAKGTVAEVLVQAAAEAGDSALLRELFPREETREAAFWALLQRNDDSEAVVAEFGRRFHEQLDQRARLLGGADGIPDAVVLPLLRELLDEVGSPLHGDVLRCLARRSAVDPSFDSRLAALVGVPPHAADAERVLRKLPRERLLALEPTLRGHLGHADLRSHRAAARLLRTLK